MISAAVFSALCHFSTTLICQHFTRSAPRRAPRSALTASSRRAIKSKLLKPCLLVMLLAMCLPVTCANPPLETFANWTICCDCRLGGEAFSRGGREDRENNVKEKHVGVRVCICVR